MNVESIGDRLDSVALLDPVTYDRKDGKRKGEVGLIAEEVYKVLPEIVSKNDDGEIEGIEYSKLTVYLISAVKQLKRELDELKNG